MNKDRLLYAGEFLERNLFEPLTAEDLAAATALVHTGHGQEHARALGLAPLTQAMSCCLPSPGSPTLQARSLADILQWLVQLKSSQNAHRI